MTKTRIIRIISLLLAMITLAFAVSCGASSCSCKGKKSNSTNNSNSPSDSADQDIQFESEDSDTEKSTEKKPSNLHGQFIFGDSFYGTYFNFEGKEISILYRDNIQSSREWFKETLEDQLDEQIYFINDQAEKDLEVQIIFKPIASNGIDLTDYKSRFHNEILDDVLSGQHKYDISANMACYTASPAIRNYAANLLDTERFPYFNFEPGTTPDGGWYSSLIEDTAINGKLYYLSGIMNTSLIDATPVVWYNHTLYRKLREESDPESLQETVLAGDWTYDELYKWTSASHDDFDGLGLIVNKNNTAPLGSVPYACDIDFVVKNPGGGHSFYIKENERITQAFEKLNTILDCDNTSTDATVTSFAEGRALFYMDVIFRNCEENSLIREMEYSYGLLPLPKYDKSQTHYFSTPDDFYTLMLVPDHKFGDNATDGALVSAFLQHRNYNAVSTAQIAGYHFNQTIKPRYFGVYEYPTCSSLSLTIQIWDEHILPGIRLDFASVYSPQLNYLSYLWTEAIERREYPAQVFEEYKEMFDAALKNTDEWLRS